MWLFPGPIQLTYKTSRSKTQVISSLEDIATFTGDSFRFPVKIFGNKLMMQRRVVVGRGVVTEADNHTCVNVTLQPSGQIGVAFILTLVFSLIVFVIALGLLFSGQFLFSIGLMVASAIMLVPPRIAYSVAFEIKRERFMYLIQRGR